MLLTKALFVATCVAFFVVAVILCTSILFPSAGKRRGHYAIRPSDEPIYSDNKPDINPYETFPSVLVPSASKHTHRGPDAVRPGAPTVYFGNKSQRYPYRTPPAVNPKNDSTTTLLKLNIVIVYVGRWQFLQLQLPYLYRDLRKNGGLLDKVQFMMMMYDGKTRERLTNFTETANIILGEEVFTINYMGYIPSILQPGKDIGFLQAFYELCKQLYMNPQHRYFKFDDDVVYIHPEAFKNMIDKSRPDCEIHYFNIAGVNYMCSWLYQKYGVFDGLNPKNYIMQKKWHGGCGYTSVDCAKFTIELFLHFYKESKLEKYFVFDVERLTNRERFSINGFLLQNTSTTMKFKEMLEAKKPKSDESFLHGQFKQTTNPPCIVGKALIVHFGYTAVTKQLLKLGLLKPFYELVEEAKDTFHMSSELWQVLDGYKISG